MSKNISLNEFSDIFREVLESGGEVAFVTAGVSMLPMLRDRKDKVIIVKPSKKLKKNDVPFFQREDGSFVLHRVVGIDENGYIMRGDNQWFTEKGIKDSQIIAVVRAFERNGKLISCSGVKYKLYCFFLPTIRCWRKKTPPIFDKLFAIRAKIKSLGRK